MNNIQPTVVEKRSLRWLWVIIGLIILSFGSYFYLRIIVPKNEGRVYKGKLDTGYGPVWSEDSSRLYFKKNSIFYYHDLNKGKIERGSTEPILYSGATLRSPDKYFVGKDKLPEVKNYYYVSKDNTWVAAVTSNSIGFYNERTAESLVFQADHYWTVLIDVFDKDKCVFYGVLDNNIVEVVKLSLPSLLQERLYKGEFLGDSLTVSPDLKNIAFTRSATAYQGGYMYSEIFIKKSEINL